MSKKDIALSSKAIKSIELDGERQLRVIATAPTLDRDLEVIDTSSMQVPVKPKGLKYAADLTEQDEVDVPFLIDHNWALEKQAGYIKSLFINANGELEAVVQLANVDNGDRVYALAKDGALGNSFSIGFTLQNATLEDGIVKNVELLELSAVFKGSNRDARLLEVKSVKEEKSMSEAEKLKAEIEAKTLELAELEAKDAETPEVEAPVVEAEEVETPAEEIKSIVDGKVKGLVADVANADSSWEKEDEKWEAMQPVSDLFSSLLTAWYFPTTKIEEFDALVTEFTSLVSAIVNGKEVKEISEDLAKALGEKTIDEIAEVIKSSKKEEVNPNKKEIKMSKDIALEAIEAKAVELPTQKGEVVKTIKKAEARKMIVDALAAKFAKDDAAFAQIESNMADVKVINGTSGAALFVQEILAQDIRDAYSVQGRVGQLVNNIDIEGAETFKQLVETAGNGFQPVALGGVKPQDQPVWGSVVSEPFEWALIVAWLDGVQKRSPIAVYNQIVRYIAKEYAKLQDKIVLTYAGGAVGTETRPATGLVPILTTAGRVTPVASYGSADVVAALGAAYGAVRSDDTITLVANRATWAQLAVAVDGQARPLFTVVGEQVSAGALGSFNVVLSEALADGDVVVGAFADYNLVTRGGLSTLFSREATVGSLNLFTQDASALRADVDITGTPVFNTSFHLLQFGTES